MAPRALRRAIVALMTTAVAAANPASAQEVTPEERVDEIFSDVVGPGSPGCALSVIRDGAPKAPGVWEKAGPSGAARTKADS